MPSPLLIFHLTRLMGADNRSQPTTRKRKQRVEDVCAGARERKDTDRKKLLQRRVSLKVGTVQFMLGL